MVDPCGHKTQLSHNRTDPQNNLRSLLISTMYNLLMALDDVLSDGQAHHTTQQYDIFTQPPGAATTDLPSSTHPRPADFLFEDLFPPGHLDAGLRHSTQMPSTFSIDNQSDGSETSVYTPSPADPTLSFPPSTHAPKPRPSFFRSS
jgi:hypothetical protein